MHDETVRSQYGVSGCIAPNFRVSLGWPTFAFKLQASSSQGLISLNDERLRQRGSAHIYGLAFRSSVLFDRVTCTV